MRRQRRPSADLRVYPRRVSCSSQGTDYMETEQRDRAVVRLRCSEGQVRGIRKTVEENRCCIDVRAQTGAAIRCYTLGRFARKEGFTLMSDVTIEVPHPCLRGFACKSHGGAGISLGRRTFRPWRQRFETPRSQWDACKVALCLSNHFALTYFSGFESNSFLQPGAQK